MKYDLMMWLDVVEVKGHPPKGNKNVCTKVQDNPENSC